MAKMKIKECSLEILKDMHKAYTQLCLVVCVGVSVKVVLQGNTPSVDPRTRLRSTATTIAVLILD